ncbi:hypothetical protein MTO96_008058 [Rhipicephalus appendiculatus]
MPTEFNFGTIGSLLAREISHVITPASSKEWWDERSQQGFREHTDCLRKLHRQAQFIMHLCICWAIY